MRRILLAVVVAATALVPVSPFTIADVTGCSGSPLDPDARYPRYVPLPAGQERSYCVFYGPYVIPGGHDLSRVDFDLAVSGGFVVAGGPSLVLADGREPSHQQAHIHHSHWWFVDPEDRDREPLPWMRWISGSGEEVTRGDFRQIANADPAGPRYGIHVKRGDRIAMINMIHNKYATPLVIWIKVDLAFVHGSPDEIEAATGQRYHDVTGVLVGSTFDAHRGSGVGGAYTYPRDDSGPPDPADGIVPGLGQVWRAPFSGTMVIGAGHLHPGGRRVLVKNLGRVEEPGQVGPEDDPCPSDGRGGIPGTTLYELDLVDRVPNARFTEDFQIEITKPGFRAAVREGDVLALNGVYDTSEHGWWDAMSFTGFYVDEHDPPEEGEACTARLADDPAGDPSVGMENRPWSGDADPLCGAEFGRACDENRPPPASGVATDAVAISGYRFQPGDQGLSDPLRQEAIVARGTRLRFVNADVAAYVRHSVTSCRAPCDGPYVANYPLPDGTFDSGYLGWEPTTGGRMVPSWELETATLDAGRYTYFCRVHPFMRGSFTVA